MPYREIAYHDFAMSKAIVHGTRETLIPDSPMKSRNCISRFQASCCQVNWTFQSPDPRFSDEASCRASPGGARLLPRVLPNGRSRLCRDFETFVVPMHTTLRTPISQWTISRCLSRLLSSCSRGLILCVTSADPTAVGDPAPNLTTLTAFDHSPL